MTKENNNRIEEIVFESIKNSPAILEGDNGEQKVVVATNWLRNTLTTAIEEARVGERREILQAYRQTTGIDEDVFTRALEALSEELPEDN